MPSTIHKHISKTLAIKLGTFVFFAQTLFAYSFVFFFFKLQLFEKFEFSRVFFLCFSLSLVFFFAIWRALGTSLKWNFSKGPFCWKKHPVLKFFVGFSMNFSVALLLVAVYEFSPHLFYDPLFWYYNPAFLLDTLIVIAAATFLSFLLFTLFSRAMQHDYTPLIVFVSCVLFIWFLYACIISNPDSTKLFVLLFSGAFAAPFFIFLKEKTELCNTKSEVTTHAMYAFFYSLFSFIVVLMLIRSFAKIDW